MSISKFMERVSMAPQVLLKNGNVRERQRVRIDETHSFTEKTE